MAISWTLVGLVLNGILLGAIATSLTTLSLEKEVKLYGSKVGFNDNYIWLPKYMKKL